MNFDMFATWVLVGLLTGWLAGFVVKGGGHGVVWDLFLGLAGSSAAAGGFWVLSSPEGSRLATAVVAFAGAAVTIIAQRKLGPAHV